MSLSNKEYQEGLIHYQGWKFNAWKAYGTLYFVKDFYNDFSKDKKVSTMKSFYDSVFACTPHDTNFVSLEVTQLKTKPKGGYGEHTKDHPFSARVAGRAILEDHQYLINNFEIFTEEFLKLISVVGVVPIQNQDVKVTKDGFGGIIVKGLTTKRYEGISWRFHSEDEWYTVNKFPLEIMSWYNEYEIKKNKQWIEAGCDLKTYQYNLYKIT